LLLCQSRKYLIGAGRREWKRGDGWVYGFIIHGASLQWLKVDAESIVL
jgi:hypothetical protein